MGAAHGHHAEPAAHRPHDVPDELPSHLLRHARRRSRTASSSRSRATQTIQIAMASSAFAADPRTRSRATRCASRRRCSGAAREAPSSGTRSPGTTRWTASSSAIQQAGRERVGVWTGHGAGVSGIGNQMARRFGYLSGFQFWNSSHRLLGARRLRPATDRHPRLQHQGRPRRQLADHHHVGRQPRQPADDRPASDRRPRARRHRRRHRRPPHRDRPPRRPDAGRSGPAPTPPWRSG